MLLRRILVLGNRDEIRQLGYRAAQEVLVADDFLEAADITSTVKPDLILLDGRQQYDKILTFLEIINSNPQVPVVIVGADSGQFSRTLSGPMHYLPGVADLDGLRQIISRTQPQTKPDNTASYQSGHKSRATSDNFFADELSASVLMAGKSKAILNTLKMIKLVAGSNCNPVLIMGETGTGKELAAKAVHNLRHAGEKFVAVNCAALTATLLESELFGHVKGSFTGADRDKTGLLEIADQGTIFLDEISEMPLDLQAKLLRVLQEKTFRKVGGTADTTCKATIIASSNRNLRQEVKANRFRRDLYYRLNICPITIAPLRDPSRGDDIRLLADYFLKNSAVSPNKTGKITAITEMALETLEKYDWPGNVRELRNVIERAILLETTDKIGLSSIIIEPADDIEEPKNENKKQSQDFLSSVLGPSSSAGNACDFSLEKAERELIARALQESGWQKTKAAALLGITRATLYAKVKQHNIQKGTYIPILEPAATA
jgi:transcriptional regulator with PAS, ATPase and Fis domain